MGLKDDSCMAGYMLDNNTVNSSADPIRIHNAELWISNTIDLPEILLYAENDNPTQIAATKVAKVNVRKVSAIN
ncbi:hypothetical protein D3C72_1541180 [compost metagenome]